MAEVYDISKKTAGRFPAAFLRNIKSDELVWSRRRLPLDNEHLTNVASGDKAVFSELYDLTRTAVYGLALSYMRSAHDAQDITQDTFVRVWESSGKYRQTGSTKSWILTICKNLCLMELRKSSCTKLLDDEEWDAIPEDASGLSFDEKDLLGNALMPFRR